MTAYRVVVFVDVPEKTRGHNHTVTQDVVEEVEHAILLYHEDQPLGTMFLSSVTPYEEKV